MTLVTVERIAAGGAGVGRLGDGMTVFVPRTAPGDLVEVSVVQRKRRYALARLQRILSPGAARVAPQCPHYERDRCGGCQLQHVEPSVQLEVKRQLVGEALRRIGRRAVPDPDIVPSPHTWRYRSKITLAAAGGRIGLRPYDQPDRVFELHDCPITCSPLMELWRRIRTERRFLPPGLSSVVLREDREGRRHVVIGDDGREPWDATPLAKAVGASDVSFWWKPSGGAPRVVYGPRPGFPPLAFEQINRELASRIREDAVAALGQVSGKAVWDLYGGVGDTAQLLTQRGAKVWVVDMDQRAMDWAAARGSSRAIQWVTSRVEEALHRLPEPEAVIVNPPRAGMHRRVSRHLASWGARRPGVRLAYLSCDPATLARDLGRMPSLTLRSVLAYDLFPQTGHVETLAVLQAS